jgi:hypothetical protein
MSGTIFRRFSSHIASQPANGVQFQSEERLAAASVSWPVYRHHIRAYEMKQISADFHLISRLSGSHLNSTFFKSH